jgi:hypothetical protein
VINSPVWRLGRALVITFLCAGSVGACNSGRAYVPKKNDGGADATDTKPDTPANDTPAADTDIDGSISTPDVADDSMPTCPANQHLCAGACVDDTDPKTCGGSCSRCPDPVGGTATCEARICGGSCTASQKLCHGACIDMGAACDGTCPTGTHACGSLCPSNQDVTSCGTSCMGCPVPSGALQATCDGTKCDFTCSTGYHKCGAACVRDDAAGACGAACVSCPTGTKGTPICVSGTCSLTCDAGYHLCGGQCASDTDVATCGTSCSPCSVPTNGSATCGGGMCGGACPTGKQLCAGACIDSGLACLNQCQTGSHNCTGLCSSNTSVNSCGATACSACASPTGASQTTCDGTMCAFSCGTGYHKCGTTCATDSDPNACGSGCVKCPTDPKGAAVCQSGVCGIMCATGYHQCPASTGACVANTLLSGCGTSSCSACPVPTNGSATCDGLSCGTMCPSGMQLCNGACIAGNVACNGTCPTGQHNCSGICAADTAPATCGARCAACPAPASHGVASCVTGGNCGYACDASYRNCPGTNLCVASTAPGCCSMSDCTNPALPICTNNVCVGRTLGSTCSAGTECASGACAEGVCCTTACTGKCTSCLKANTGQNDGTCAAVTANTAHGSDCSIQAASTCGTTGKCDGAGACVKWPATTVCLAQSCPQDSSTQTAASTCNGAGTCVAGGGTPCSFYQCNSATAICRTTCSTSADCSSGYFCNAGTCAKKPNGFVCGAASECLSGNCGGRCCPAGTTCNCPQPSASNLLANPGFDTNLSGWTLTTPASGSSGPARWDMSDVNSCPYSGSMYIYHFGFDESATFSQCVPISAAKTYNFGGAINDTNCVNVWCDLRFYNGGNCGGVEVTDGSPPEFTWTGPVWGPSNVGPVTPPSDAVSAKVVCQSSPPYSPDCWSSWDSLYLSPSPATY